MKTYEKTEEGQLKVSETKTEEKVVTHSYEFLVSQREQILKDQVRVQAELDEIDQLIGEAEKLGIEPKVVEEETKII